MVSVELRARVCGGYVVMLRGELDSADAESTASAVTELAEGGQQLIIDLEGVPGVVASVSAVAAGTARGDGPRRAPELPVRRPPECRA